MSERTKISASLRWSIYARDGFMCRYCGARAGQPGVELVLDHVVSVVDGGDGSESNLVTSCQRCNGGKGARSLQDVPSAEHRSEQLAKSRDDLIRQRDAIAAVLQAERDLDQQAVNLKCQAYGVQQIRMKTGERKIICNLCREFDPVQVLGWYEIACKNGVAEIDAVKYVCGIARKVRMVQPQQISEPALDPNAETLRVRRLLEAAL